MPTDLRQQSGYRRGGTPAGISRIKLIALDNPVTVTGTVAPRVS